MERLRAPRNPRNLATVQVMSRWWRAQSTAFRWLLPVWLLVMIGMPIVGWTLGEDALRRAVSLGVGLQAALVLAMLVGALGWPRALPLAGGVAALGWAAEALGSKTGVPFGAYHYTDALQPQLAGVPLAIPFAWLMMLPPAWAVAARIGGRWRGVRFVVLSALAMTAWDLFLDPQMVGLGLWEWAQPGGYFGIPWVNFGGWLLVSGLITAVLRPPPLPAAPLLAVYGLTLALEAIGLGVFWGQPGPALVGTLAMGALLALALRQPGDVA